MYPVALVSRCLLSVCCYLLFVCYLFVLCAVNSLFHAVFCRFMEPSIIATLGGVLPFGSIFIEMHVSLIHQLYNYYYSVACGLCFDILFS